MGASQGSHIEFKEIPDPNATATLYYYAGRGKADQIRWMLAATMTKFVQKTINDRSRYLSLEQTQLPFGELPLLQIDNLEIVQSQACIRYLAVRGGLQGCAPEDTLKCDMIAEACRDLIDLACEAPFKKFEREDIGKEHVELMRSRWALIGARLEAILVHNGGKYLAGPSLTYADILVAHALTWYVEECGSDIVENMSTLVDLQNTVIEMPGLQEFIRSKSYFPVSGEPFVKQVLRVEGRLKKTDGAEKNGKSNNGKKIAGK